MQGRFTGTFNGCTSLSSVDFSSLASIERLGAFSGAFTGCTNLQSLNFPELTAMTAQAVFQNNDKLKSIYLPKCTSITQTNIFNGDTDLTAIHFAAANETAIKATSGYGSKWGAPNANCQVLFDL